MILPFLFSCPFLVSMFALGLCVLWVLCGPSKATLQCYTFICDAIIFTIVCMFVSLICTTDHSILSVFVLYLSWALHLVFAPLYVFSCKCLHALCFALWLTVQYNPPGFILGIFYLLCVPLVCVFVILPLFGSWCVFRIMVDCAHHYLQWPLSTSSSPPPHEYIITPPALQKKGKK